MLSLKVRNGHVLKLSLPDGNIILIRRHQDDYLAIEAPPDISISRMGYINMETMTAMCKKVHEEATDGPGVTEDTPRAG